MATTRPTPPVRSFFILLLFGVGLLSLALVVRSGMWESQHPDEPINATMREALAENHHELTTNDSLLVEQLYPTAAVTQDGLRFVVHDPGTGPKAQRGDLLTVRYAGRLLDGTPLDSTYATAAPLRFHAGTGAVLRGLDEAFLDMRRGEKRTLILPYWLAYGAAGKPPMIPPKATVIYEAELIGIEQGL